MKPSTFVWKASASILFYTALVNAQGQVIPVPYQPQPSQAWNPVSVCTNGLADPADPNGLYTDVNGAQWAIHCGQASDGATFDPGQGTNGQGVTACMNGCDNRPGCTAWGFKGTVNSATSGAGQCFYKYAWGSTYSTDTTFYASAELIQASPNKPCPYWNQSTFVDTQNYIWQVSCGYDSSASTQTFTGGKGNMESCMTQCNALTACNGFSFNYGGAENTNPPPGACFFKAGSRVTGRSTPVNVALRIGSVQPDQPLTTLTPYSGPTTSTTTTTRTTSTTTSTSTTTTSTSTTTTTTQITTTTTRSDTTTTATSSDTTTTTTTTYPATTTTTTYPTTTTMSTTTTRTTTTTSSSTTANPTSTCTNAPVPSVPACPGSSGQSFIDSCGTNYTVWCGYDTTPGSVKTVNAGSLLECMQQCDNYPGCRAATLGGQACYLKTGFSATTGGGTQGVNSIVRYIPPNLNFAVPPQAPCQNCSAGCGNALPAGYVPGGATVNIANVVNPSDGKARAIAIHIPKFYDPNKASPVIFGFPGNADDTAGIEGQTGMSDGTVNPYGIMVYVTGYQKGFQSNPDWSNLGVDDVGFVNYLINNVTNQFCVDTGRLFATGHSNGGGFANMLACDPVMSVKFAAFAFNSGACYTSALSGNPSTIDPVNTPDQPQCAPGRNNVPWLEIHGTADGTIDYNGGVRRGRLLPTIPRLATAWAVRQGLGSSNYTTTPATGVTQYQFGGDIGQLGIVTHYRLTGWGHFWAKVNGGAPMDSTPAIMDFFYRWSDPNRAATYPPVSSSSSSGMSSTSTVSSSTASSSTVSTSSSSSSSSSSSAGATTTTTSTPSTTSSSSSSSSSMTMPATTTTSTTVTTTASTTSSSPSSSSSSSSIMAQPTTTTTTSTTSISSSRTSSSSSSPSSAMAMLTTTTTTSTSSSRILSSATAYVTGVPIPARNAACPDSNGQQVVDDLGIVYTLGCGNDTTNGSLENIGVSNGFHECFSLCDNLVNTPAGYCSSFTFVAANNEVDVTGAGRCYLKSDRERTGFTAGRPGLVGAIRNSPQDVPTATPYSGAGSSTTSGSAGNTPRSSTGTSTSLSASPTATIACGSSFVDATGTSYNTYCNSDTNVGSFDNELVRGDFTACAPGCASRPNCRAFVFNPYSDNTGGTCFYKDQAGDRVPSTGYIAGIRVAPSSSSSLMQQTTSQSSTAGQNSQASSSTSSTMMASSPNNQATSSTSSIMMASSSTSSTRPMPTYRAFRLADVQCPRDDRKYVTDYYGIDYKIGCSSDTAGGSVHVAEAASSFKDCFALCDNAFATYGGDCTSFVYLGGANGVGGGNCYFKDYPGADNGFTSSDANYVGAIRVSPYDVVTAVPGSTTSTSSSSPGGASSPTPYAGETTTSSMVEGSSPPPYAGETTTSSMTGGMSSSSAMGDMSSSTAMGGMTTSTDPGGMQSSSPAADVSTSVPGYDDQSSMDMHSSTATDDMSTMPMDYMTPSSSRIASGSAASTTTSRSSSVVMVTSVMSNGMTTTSPSPAPSPELPDESSFFAGQSSSAVVSSPAPYSSPNGAQSSDLGASTPTDEPSYGVSSPVAATTTGQQPSGYEEPPVSSTTSLEACPVQTEGLNSGDGGACKDPYGNTFNITYGTVYQGRITVRAVRPNVASCLVLCDETPGCEAVNYIGSECQVLTEVTGNYTAPGVDAVAATRPADASTTYTVPPTSMSSMMATSAPVSNGSPATTNGGPGGYSTPASQGGSNPGSSPGASQPVVTGIYTPTNGGQPSTYNNGGSPGQSTPGGNQGSSQGGQQSYASTNGQVSSGTLMPTTANPTYGGGSAQSSGAPGQTTINGGAGPVDASNSNIVPDGYSTATGSMSVSMQSLSSGGAGSMTNGGNAGSLTNIGGYGSQTGGGQGPQPTTGAGTATFSYDGNQNNGGTLRSSTAPPASSAPASTGAVCPFYDNSQYTDSRGSTYTVDCNGTYAGDVLLRTNSTTMPANYKRQAPAAYESGKGLLALQCMNLCDTYPGCIAINMDCAGTCSLLSSVASTTDGTCGVAARRISGGSGGNGGSGGGGDAGVSTITVCAARTGTITVFTTATLTTCAANGTCPSQLMRR